MLKLITCTAYFFIQIDRYFKAGGAPEQVVTLLSDNYQAVAQTANVLAEWLIHAGNTAFCKLLFYIVTFVYLY